MIVSFVGIHTSYMLRDGKCRELNFPWDFAWFTWSKNYYHLDGKI